MRQKLSDAMKDAMRNKEQRRLATVRLILAAIKERDIAARAPGKDQIADDEILQVLAKMLKQREESVKIYSDAGREDLAAQEREEMDVIRTFMPVQMSEDEVREAASAAISETGAAGMKDMGKVIGVLKERFPGQMDFGKASGIVKSLLG